MTAESSKASAESHPFEPTVGRVHRCAICDRDMTVHPEASAAYEPHEHAGRGAAEVIAEALQADHRDCDPESCCQRNSGPDYVEAGKVLAALRAYGYEVTRD